MLQKACAATAHFTEVAKALVASRRLLTKGAQAKKNQKFYEELPVKEWKRKRGDIEAKAAHKD